MFKILIKIFYILRKRFFHGKLFEIRKKAEWFCRIAERGTVLKTRRIRNSKRHGMRNSAQPTDSCWKLTNLVSVDIFEDFSVWTSSRLDRYILTRQDGDLNIDNDVIRGECETYKVFSVMFETSYRITRVGHVDSSWFVGILVLVDLLTDRIVILVVQLVLVRRISRYWSLASVGGSIRVRWGVVG